MHSLQRSPIVTCMSQAKTAPPRLLPPGTAGARDELGVLISALYDVANLARRSADGDPVEPAGMRVLVWVQALANPRPSELACELRLDLSTVSRHVRALTADGFLTAERDADDGRAQRIALTDAGHAAIATVVANRRQTIGEAIAHWPDADRADLTNLLRRLADDLAGRQS